MKLVASIIALILLALIIPFLVPTKGPDKPVDVNLPWQIQTDGQGGSSVFGLRLDVSTLADVRQQFGGDADVAIIAAPGETGTVEAYYEQVPLGFVLGKLIVTLDLPAETITAMRERALRAKPMESTTRKITLHPDDLAVVERAPIRGISVIPSVNLDEATVVQRFGPPEERLAISDKRTHLLYASRGLDVIVDSDGKELLQYVAPRDFARLRAPLTAAGS